MNGRLTDPVAAAEAARGTDAREARASVAVQGTMVQGIVAHGAAPHVAARKAVAARGGVAQTAAAQLAAAQRVALQAAAVQAVAARARGAGRLVAACGLTAMLAACTGGLAGGGAGGTATGGTGFLGLRNPLAGLGSGGGIDPDLRGRIGGGLDTSGGVAGTGGTARGGAAASASGAVVDPFAGQGVSQPQIPPGGGTRSAAGGTPTPNSTTTTSASGTAAAAASAPSGRPAQAAAATTHTVAAGETAWSVARRYGVTVADLARANALPEGMTVRVGQRLSIPAGGRQASLSDATAPGTGSPTPEPPSASKPLPREATTPAGAPVAKPAAPDLGATRTAASGAGGRFRMPVSGSIVRAYAKGRNEGIDISAPTGTPVKAAGGGTVAAITRDTDGVPIVVVRHDGSLMTVYSGLDTLTVAKGDKVSAGEAIGKSSAAGVLHFEVRQGFESVDPETYLR